MGLRDQLAGEIPAGLLGNVSDHFEVIGDVAVLSLPGELEPFRTRIARAVVAKRKNITTVLNKTEKIGGDSRTARYEILVGDKTVTTYREFGFSYRIDIAGSFLSARMASERKRVTDQVRPGERVCVPFAGVGPFAIPAAKKGAHVLAVENNPDAFRWLNENVSLNRVRENCRTVSGDALDIAQIPQGSFDRLIIPAPYGLDHALDLLLPLMTDGGMAHFYTFKPKEEIPGLVSSYVKKGLVVRYSSACGNVAPGIRRYVFDLVRPK